MKGTTIRFRLTEAMKGKLTVVADEREQTISEFLRQRGLDAIREYEKIHGPISISGNATKPKRK